MRTSDPPSTTADTIPNAGIPKLRASCDSCGECKVKCDRKQPECRRCTSLGLLCVYGPSRLSGKPPRKRLATDVLSSNRCKKPFLEAIASHDRFTEISDELPQLERQHLAISNSAALPSTVDLFSTACADTQDAFGSSFNDLGIFDEWPQMNGFALGFGFPHVEKSSASDNGLLVPAIPPMNYTRIDAASRQSHSCPRESYEIFRDLICPSANLHAPESNSDLVSAQLDEVLRCTRNAVNRLTRLLRCSCARSGHRVMVHASIISRILLWYQQAAGWISSDAWPTRSLELADFPTSLRASPSLDPPLDTTTDKYTERLPTLAQTTGFIVEHVPVSVGTFSVEDHSVQASLRDQLVLSELKNTANLIDLFTSTDACESSANSIAAPLGAWLRNEHSRTVRIMSKTLDKSDGNLR